MVVLECPWCGASADIQLQSTPEGFFYVQVRCSNKKCLALCPHGLFSTEDMPMKKAEDEAIKSLSKGQETVQEIKINWFL